MTTFGNTLPIADRVSSGPTFSLQYTTRRNPNNPQSGVFGNITVRPNLRLLGSDQNWQSVMADFRKYVPLSADGRHILAFWNLKLAKFWWSRSVLRLAQHRLGYLLEYGPGIHAGPISGA